MRKLVSFCMFAIIGRSAFARTTARPSMVSQYVGPAPRIVRPSPMNGITTDKSSTQPIVLPEPIPATVNRDREKRRCMNNNIGIGNTFVWASKFNNTNNYASMVEDIENPENNVCFVKVELKSSDSKISVADIAPIYYEMGTDITCGDWANRDMLQKRILDAKKSARTWGTVAGVVGGAGVGVGAMELFGNRLINGRVEGQKANNLSDAEVLRSQLLVLKEKNRTEYNQFISQIRELKTECESDIWSDNRPQECDEIDYNALLKI